MDLLKSKPEKAINGLVKNLALLESGDVEKSKPKLTQGIQTIHRMLYGDSDNEPKKSDIDYIVPHLCNSENDLFKKMGENLKSYDFESKKKTAEIMNYIVRRTGKEDNPFADYLKKNKKIVTDLLKGYHDPNLSQNVGSVLQEMCKRSELAKLLLNDIKVKIHNYNNWDTVIKAQQDAINQQKQESQQSQAAAANNGAPAAAASEAKNNEDAPEAAGPAMPDWNRERTAPEAKQENDKVAETETEVQAATEATETKEEKQAASGAAAAADNSKVIKGGSDVNNNNNNINEKKEYNDMVDELFILVQNPSFDIASDAYKTLQLLLTRHKKEVSKYLDINYRLFFLKFNYLIMSENYVTKRQFLKLLSELLLDKHNFRTMLKYISEKDNLINSMKLIKNPSKAIAFEAFHIFKVFVANPNKSRDVHIVLYKNQEKLIKFLTDFLKDKEDQSFISEKEIVIQHLTNMEMPEEIRIKLEERRKAEQEQQEQQQQNKDNENNTNDNSENAQNNENNGNGDNANNDTN